MTGKNMVLSTIAASVMLGGGWIGLVHTQAQAADASAAANKNTNQVKKDGGFKGRGAEGRPGFGGFGGGPFKEVATILGVDESAVMDAVKSGKTLAAFAAEKGVSEDVLLQKLTDARTKAIDAAVTAGKLTQAQADKEKANLADRLKQEVEGTGFGKGRGGDMHEGFGGFGGGTFKEVATILGVDESAVMDAVKSGKTLAAFAAEKGVSEDVLLQKLTDDRTKAIDAAVTAGKLTQAQADKEKANLADRLKKEVESSGFGKGRRGDMHEGFGFGGPFKEVATILGVDENAVMDAVKSGKTLAAFAAEKGVSEDVLLQKLTDARTKAIDAAVTAGKLTQAQADKEKANLADHLKKEVESTGFGKGRGGDMHEGFGGFGGGAFKEVATILGVDESAVMDAVKSGKTLAAFAAEKGVTEDVLLQKLTDTRTKAIDAAVTAGKLTQAQADKEKANLADRLKKEVESTGFGKGPQGKPGEFGGRGHGGAWGSPDAVAQILGMTKQELTTALQSGKSISDLAKEKGISEDQLAAKLKELRSQKAPAKPQDSAAPAAAAL
ncbi:hypothetical protein [Paenibacillus gyeongsangnamensis]|uniref:hypothetical protein n=1 Tax=Paenibacillus gyeongsangnamensis TaxID=3388067 RepID=UPI0022B86513|nr:hypothetical protein [Paenibacillus filicis]